MFSIQFVTAIIASFIISLGSLVGILSFWMSEKRLQSMLHALVAFAAGAMIGSAFLHLLPEASEFLEGSSLFNAVLVSFVLFFLIEKTLHWRHRHDDADSPTFGTMNLIGDAIHNLLDGLILAGAFIADIRLGWVTALAMALHEIPQEVGDFGVLVKSGYSKKKALQANFLTALTAVVGVVVGFVLVESVDSVMPYLLAVASGGFIYIAASDLIPEIREENDLDRSLTSFATFLLGICLMFLLTFIE